jgi:hypothetical protein
MLYLSNADLANFVNVRFGSYADVRHVLTSAGIFLECRPLLTEQRFVPEATENEARRDGRDEGKVIKLD